MLQVESASSGRVKTMEHAVQSSSGYTTWSHKNVVADLPKTGHKRMNEEGVSGYFVLEALWLALPRKADNLGVLTR